MNTRIKTTTFRMLALITVALLLQTTLVAKEIRFSGMIRSYLGGRISEGDVPINEQTLNFNLQGWGSKTKINVNPYVYVLNGSEMDIGVREVYIDLLFSKFDIRIGKQAVVWGEAEGAFITDIVSPQDLRSFILADFSEIRIGVPAVRTNYYVGQLTFDLVWIPLFVPTSQPDTESIWRTKYMPDLDSAVLPANKFSNSEVFGKMKYFSGAFTTEIMAGYAWDDLPVLEGSALAAVPTYKRFTVAGGSISTALSPFVLRSEVAGYLDRSFTAMPSPGLLTTSDHHQIHTLAGLDWNLWGIDMSAQYILQHILRYDDALRNKESDHTATFRMRDTYFSDTLRLEMFGYFGLDAADMLLRPALTYSLEDGVEIKTGLDLFFGDSEGKFGQYNKNSLAYVSFRWYF